MLLRCSKKEVLEALKNILYWAQAGQYGMVTYSTPRTLISAAHVTTYKK